MAALIGKIGEFQQGQEERMQQYERLEHYFAGNGGRRKEKVNITHSDKSIFLQTTTNSSVPT